ncbi:glycosyltransferase [Pseudarthrobacter sp. PvP090]|uniref:glycosyltransferase family 4 protein n=1 Tax=Pseudarthrobacter sp. PvP090 TaxID=3156393 RepID=UPI003394C5B5
MNSQEVVRFYPEVRSVHLERLSEMTPSRIYFLSKRSDFDESLLSAGRYAERTTLFRMVVSVVRNPPRVLEVPEPLWFNYTLHSWVLIRALRLLRPRASRATRIVAYAIENAEYSWIPPKLSWLPGRIWRIAARSAGMSAWAGIDRLAFGSQGAAGAYGNMARDAGWNVMPGETAIFPALPSYCSCGETALRGAESARDGLESVVTFIGALEARKGLDILLDAWSMVSAAMPGLSLNIVGTGPMEPLASESDAREASVKYLGGLDREDIHKLLTKSDIVVLPSQRHGRWREQVGLSIVEGLAHGCTVVASSETGLAEWLESNGHLVVSAPTDSGELADAILRAAARHDSRRGSVLPVRDGRIEADGWLSENSILDAASAQVGGVDGR